jgi:hypothetical protein
MLTGQELEIFETCSTQEFLTSSSLSSPSCLSNGNISCKNQSLVIDFHTLFKFEATDFLTNDDGSIARDLISFTINFSHNSTSNFPATLFKILSAETLALSSFSS